MELVKSGKSTLHNYGRPQHEEMADNNSGSIKLFAIIFWSRPTVHVKVNWHSKCHSKGKLKSVRVSHEAHYIQVTSVSIMMPLYWKKKKKKKKQ